MRGIALTFLHTPYSPLSFLGLGLFSMHYCSLALSSHAWGAGIVPRVIIGSYRGFFSGEFKTRPA